MENVHIRKKMAEKYESLVLSSLKEQDQPNFQISKLVGK